MNFSSNMVDLSINLSLACLCWYIHKHCNKIKEDRDWWRERCKFWDEHCKKREEREKELLKSERFLEESKDYWKGETKKFMERSTYWGDMFEKVAKEYKTLKEELHLERQRTVKLLTRCATRERGI